MLFNETALAGAYLIELEAHEDERGFFARSFCKQEFDEHNLNSDIAQCNISFNKQKGILRGMHYQKEPFQEVKLVRCTRGAIYDVIIDLRPDSSTYMEWISVELTENNRKMFYIPEGFAHGFQTLQDKTEVFYQMSEFYHADYSAGLPWNDPGFNIKWPDSSPILSDRDKSYSDYQR